MYINFKIIETDNIDLYKTSKNQFKNEIKESGIRIKSIEDDKKIQSFIRKLDFFEKVGTFFQLSFASLKNLFLSSDLQSKNDLTLAWKHLAKGKWVRRLSIPILLKKPSLKQPLQEEKPALINLTARSVGTDDKVSTLESTEASEDLPILESEINLADFFTSFKEESFLQDLGKKYTSLSENEKQKVRLRVNDITIDHAYSCGRNVDFIKVPMTQMAIHSLSQKLFNPFKENLIFSLGQSPAWFATMAQIDQPKPERFSFVAFSGDWYGLFDEETGKELVIDYEGRSIPRKKEDVITIHSIHKNLKLKPIEQNKPTLEQTKCFRSYLSRIGCTPKRIMEQKEPAVIVDYVNRAGGLKSFLELLFTWAEEEGIQGEQLKEHLIIQCMYDSAAELLGDEENAKAYLQDNLGIYSASPIVAFPLTENDYSPETEGIRGLFSKTRSDISEQRRLIKRFTPSLWTEENCNKSSFTEYNGQINEYILPIYANFINTLDKLNKSA